MALYQEHARRSQVRRRSRRRHLGRLQRRMRAPPDGLGRSGAPRQPGLHEARFGVFEGAAAANLGGDARMQLEAKTGTPKPIVDQSVNLGSTNVKDEVLVAAAVRGSSAAFETLFQRYHKRMFNIALSRLQNAEDADDALQQAIQQAYVHLKSFHGQARFSTWLTRITINEALMLLRKRRPGHLSIEGHQTVDEG